MVRRNAVCLARRVQVPGVTSDAYCIAVASAFVDVGKLWRVLACLCWRLAERHEMLGGDFVVAIGAGYVCRVLGAVFDGDEGVGAFLGGGERAVGVQDRD